ncbi:MAG TPA: UbiD family decarboxylase, partial [Methanocorpusculum sp.]|nr:UbiD family decarboxylase [Methanocorpusculum sp.]
MRDFIKRMMAEGLVEEITEPVSSVYEAPKRAFTSKKMLYFHNCDGHRCVMNAIYDRKSLSVALGIPEDKLVKTLAACTYAGKTHDAGKLSFGPAKLSDLPIMKHFPKDAGRYLTSGIVFSAWGGVENASIHRMEVLDDTHLIGRIVEGRHTYKLLQQAK